MVAPKMYVLQSFQSPSPTQKEAVAPQVLVDGIKSISFSFATLTELHHTSTPETF